MKSIYNNTKDKVKKYFGPKNIILMILTFTIILLIGSVFRYIYLQNIQYQKSIEESVIEQQRETEKREEEEKLIEKESPESEQQTGEIEREYREDTLMIF
jgi:anionic cell wall polymer biosynthesis LytR-Cps2A-Psr (LCP) family protein